MNVLVSKLKGHTWVFYFYIQSWNVSENRKVIVGSWKIANFLISFAAINISVKNRMKIPESWCTTQGVS